MDKDKFEQLINGLINTFECYYKDDPDGEWDGKPVKDIIALLKNINIEPKKVKYAGKVYKLVGTKKIVNGELMYGIEDEPNHIDYVKASSCEPCLGYGIKDHGKDYPTKPATFDTTLESAAYDYINSDKVKAEHMQQAYGDFIAGAKWYKEHIMKDAIDAWCHWFDNEGGASIVFNGRVAERFNDGQHLKMVLIKD